MENASGHAAKWDVFSVTRKHGKYVLKDRMTGLLSLKTICIFPVICAISCQTPPACPGISISFVLNDQPTASNSTGSLRQPIGDAEPIDFIPHHGAPARIA